MKKAVIFILLKLFELAVVIFYPYGVGLLCCRVFFVPVWLKDDSIIGIYMGGLFVGLVVPFVVVWACGMVYLLVSLNLCLTKKIHKRFFKE